MKMDYANVFTRFAANIIDGLLTVPFYIPYIILMTRIEDPAQVDEISPLLWTINLIPFFAGIVFSLWNVIYRMGKTGQSLGKKFLGIAVVDERGLPIGVGMACLREIIGKMISGMVCYLGYLNALWDDRKQGWHDKMAKSFVCYVPQNPQAPQTPQPPR